MNFKFAKRLLAAAMCASIALTPMTAFATGGSGSSSDFLFFFGGSGSSSSSSSSSTPAAAANVQTTGKVTVGGAGITSTVKGGYSVNTLAGFAITSDAGSISAAYGLSGSETPYVMAYDINAKTAPNAWACIETTAAAAGARVIGAINVDLGKRTGGKFERLPGGAGVRACIGIPGTVDPNLNYAIIRVVPGSITILPDLDSNPYTVTFDVVGGIGAYALIAY